MNVLTEVFSAAATQSSQHVPALPHALSRRTPDRPKIVGRRSELRELQEFAREAARRGAVRVMCGHAGSGKSELLEAGVKLAVAAGIRVLRCNGTRDDDPPDLSGLHQIAWPILASLPRPRATRQLKTLETLLIEGVPARRDQAQLPFSVLGVLESLSAQQPVLIAIDDWDALDEPSRDVLAFVARRTARHPMAFLVTARPHRMRLASLGGLPELPLGPLSPAESAALLATRAPGIDAHAAQELLTTAAGNPLALLELPVRSEDSAPYVPASSDRLASAMAPGSARIPAATRDLLLVAALHPAGDVPLLLSAAARIEGAALDFTTVEPAEREGLVTFDGTRLRFSHPAAAGALVHQVGRQRCRAAHAALAAVLPRDSVRMLWHLSQASEGTDPELAGRLETMHRQALDQGDPPLAVRLLRRAADLYCTPEDRGRSTLRAAQLAHDLGLEGMARTLAHRALHHPQGPLGKLCAEALTLQGHGGTQPPADLAAWPAPVGPDEEENALELARLTAPCTAPGPGCPDVRLAFLDTLPQRADDPRLLHAMATVAPVRRAATVISRLSTVQGLGDLSVRDLERLGEAALLAGDPPRALDFQRQAERHYRFHDLLGHLPRVLLQQGLAHLVMGDWAQAEPVFRSCGELADQYGRNHHAAAAGLLLDLVRGLRTGAVHPGSTHDREAARRSVPSIDEILTVGTAWAQVEGGDFAAGFTTLSALLTDPERCPAVLFAVVPFAEAAAALNAAQDARATLNRLGSELGTECTPLVSIRLAVALAVLSDDQEAESLYERAVALDLPRWPSLEAPLRLAHGRRLRRLHQVADSRLVLRQAATAFTMMGAEARAARIAAELRASGERLEGGVLGPLQPAAGELLSPKEMRIAELAGQGLSNRQIGELLHLAPRTIGAYLYRIFPRLGVTARTQLSEALRSDRST